MCLIRPAFWRPALLPICPASFKGRHALLKVLQLALENDARKADRGGALLGVGGAGGVPELVGVGGELGGVPALVGVGGELDPEDVGDGGDLCINRSMVMRAVVVRREQ